MMFIAGGKIDISNDIVTMEDNLAVSYKVKCKLTNFQMS